jgi:hypothetical protein
VLKNNRRPPLPPNQLVSQHGTLYSISRCVVIASSSARSRRNQILSKIALKHLMSANRRCQGILADPSSSEAASEMVAAALMQPEHLRVWPISPLAMMAINPLRVQFLPFYQLATLAFFSFFSDRVAIRSSTTFQDDSFFRHFQPLFNSIP